jgi:hypothetical protein
LANYSQHQLEITQVLNDVHLISIADTGENIIFIPLINGLQEQELVKSSLIKVTIQRLTFIEHKQWVIS